MEARNSDDECRPPPSDEERLRRVRERAYQLWEVDSCPEGRDREHWLRAERELFGSAAPAGA